MGLLSQIHLEGQCKKTNPIFKNFCSSFQQRAKNCQENKTSFSIPDPPPIEWLAPKLHFQRMQQCCADRTGMEGHGRSVQPNLEDADVNDARLWLTIFSLLENCRDMNLMIRPSMTEHLRLPSPFPPPESSRDQHGEIKAPGWEGHRRDTGRRGKATVFVLASRCERREKGGGCFQLVRWELN